MRLLGEGELKAKLTLNVWSASAGAIKAVEAAGGSVTQARVANEAKIAARAEKLAAVKAARKG